MRLICWVFGHKWFLTDDDIQAVRGVWKLGAFRCLRCGKTKIDVIG